MLKNLWGIIKHATMFTFQLALAKATLPPEDYVCAKKQLAREARKNITQNIFQLRSFNKGNIEARKQYWFGHAFFLINILKIPQVHDELGKIGIIYNINELNIGTLIKVIKSIIDKDDALDCLLNLLKTINLTSPQQLQQPQQEQEGLILRGDAFEFAKQQIDQGYVPVINNAANSNRDGVAKCARGTLEELFARCTGAGLLMPLNFRDIEAINLGLDENQPQTIHYQKRYLIWFLTILSKVLESAAYITSKDFIKDFCGCGSNSSDPIYFDMQNTAYEVRPEEGGFTEHCAFYDPRSFASAESVEAATAQDQQPPKFGEISIVSSAAPDRRRSQFLDRWATSNTTLQNQDTGSDVLHLMLENGIERQIEEAQRLAKEGKRPYIIFVLPGCGTFGNNLQTTTEIFLKIIKEKAPKLQDQRIPFKVIEFNSTNHRALVRAGIDIHLINKNGQLIPSTAPASPEANAPTGNPHSTTTNPLPTPAGSSQQQPAQQP